VQVRRKSWAAAVSMAFLAACTQGPSSHGESAPASAGATVPLTQIGGVPVQINCGDGKQAMVRQISFDGRTASQVDCVDSRRLVTNADVQTIEDRLEVPQPEPARTRVVERVVYRDAPAPKPQVRRKRPGAESALIIGGSTAVGAGVGAVVGGKKGALIGAVVGGVGGTVYDRTTRNRK